MSTPWLLPWWRHHGVEREMCVFAAFVGEELVGGLPLELERVVPGLRVAHLMGRRHAALGGVIARAGLEQAVTEGVIARLAGCRIDYADFFGIPVQSPLVPLAAGRAALFERVEAPVLDLTDGWEAVYRAKTSSKRRNLHSRRRRQLAELGELEISVAKDPTSLSEAIQHAFRLHDLRWTGRPDGSEFTTPVGRRFNEAAVVTLGEAGIARILTLRIAGRPVAFHYYLVFAGRMFVYRLAFDPELSRFSPGLIATLAAIEAAAAEGVTTVEYLGGGERYKLELSDGPEPMYQCIGFAQTARGRVGARAARAGMATRLRFKRSPRLRAAYLKVAAHARLGSGAPPES